MVNWKEKTIVETKAGTGSEAYKTLLNLGYEEVGELKGKTGEFYWITRYFIPGHKYVQ